MAIVFTKDLSETILHHAFNNNVVKFNSDNVLDATKATITVNSIPFVITPISNNFEFNFVEIVKVLITQNNFQDDVVLELDVHQDNTLKGVYTVDYVVTLSDDSTEQIQKTYNFTRSVTQIGEYVSRPTTSQHILSNTSITMFEGYPFDLSRYSDGNFTIQNNTTNKSKVITSNIGDVERIVLNDGRYPIVVSDGEEEFNNRMTTVYKNDCMVWVEDDLIRSGYNSVSVVSANSTIDLTINKVDRCGKYLKFALREGGFGYWLFSHVYKEEETSKLLGLVDVDHSDITETFTTVRTLGKTGTKTHKLTSRGLTLDEIKTASQIKVSPRVELYTEEKGTQATSESWQTVLVKDGKQITRDTKTGLYNISIEVQVNNYTLA